tara:strand:+ start:32 stop:364 length:333 start_codon:yes stop_codon:yes gene_type:complete
MATSKILIEGDEQDKSVRRHSFRTRYLRYSFMQNKEAFEEAQKPFSYVLDGAYHNGVTLIPVEIVGDGLEDCVEKLKQSDPDFYLSPTLSLTGGWVCADYDVTVKVRSLM